MQQPDEGSSVAGEEPATLTAPMDVHHQIEELRATIGELLAGAGTTDELDKVEAETIGRRSPIAEMRRGLGRLEPDLRRETGRLINEAVSELQARIDVRRRQLEDAAESERFAAERIDVTLPGRRPRRGTHHLVQQVMDEIIDIFVAIGFTVASGPEAETDWHNFTALNIPKTHPARADSDTLYLDYGDEEESVLLRTQTSPMQVRYMQQHQPPVYVVSPGRVFRRDEVYPTHTPVFHQLEGLAVDTDITFADLKGTLAYFVKQFFGSKQRVRFLPNYFPFTEPSAEMHASCFACDGSGCRVCSNTGWIEMLGCGMVNPRVFEAVGYDPAEVTGWAFGMGIDRFAQGRHGIADLRYFWDGDVRVLEQFQ